MPAAAQQLQSSGSLQHLSHFAAALGDEQHMDEETECVVCLSALRNTACVPCGHVCMCAGCADVVQQASSECPVCRAPMDMVIQIAD